MEQLGQYFLELIGFLEEEKVDYLVIGGYAFGLDGFPRYTGNIDFTISVREGGSLRILHVFERFGFDDIDIVPEGLLRKDHVVKIDREPKKIQVLTGVDGVEHEECYRRKVGVEIGGRFIKFIGKSHLIQNKAAYGRGKGRLDLEELKKN